MDKVKYTPMMRQYLEKVVPLAERLASEDFAKSTQQLDAEASMMIDYMRLIRLINKAQGGGGAGQKMVDTVSKLFNKLRTNSGAADHQI